MEIVPIPDQAALGTFLRNRSPSIFGCVVAFLKDKGPLRVARDCDNDYPRERQSEDMEDHTNLSEEISAVPMIDLNAKNSKQSAESFEVENVTARDCEYEIPRHEDMRAKKSHELCDAFNIGNVQWTPSAENFGGRNGTSPNNELGIPGNKNLGANVANTVGSAHFLSSILENLEEGGEGDRTYKEILVHCHTPVVEDSLAMMGDGPATAGTLETVINKAGTATRNGFHDHVDGRGDCPARKRRKLMPRAEGEDAPERSHNERLLAGEYGLAYGAAATDNLHPKNGAKGDASVRHNKDFLPAGGYRLAASDNLSSNYRAEIDASVTRYKNFLLDGGYRLDANENPPSESGANIAADTGHYPETPGQSDFSSEQSRVPSTIERYPDTFNLDFNNKTNPSNFANRYGDRNHAPWVLPQIQIPRHRQNPSPDTILPSIESDVVEGNDAPWVQPQIQIPRLRQNPSSDTILPSTEPDLVEENNAPWVQPQIRISGLHPHPSSDTIVPSIESDAVEGNHFAAPSYYIPRNHADLGPLNESYLTEAYPEFRGVSLNTRAPDWLFLYAKRLGNQIEADAEAALIGQPVRQDYNPPIPFFDPNSIPTLPHHYVREYIARLLATHEAAMRGEINNDPNFLQMPPSIDKPSFCPSTLLRRPPGCQSSQAQRISPHPIGSPKEPNEDPNFQQMPLSTDKLSFLPRTHPQPSRYQPSQPQRISPDPTGSPKKVNEDRNFQQMPSFVDKPSKKPFFFPPEQLRSWPPRRQPGRRKGGSPDPIGSPRELSPPKELGPGIKNYDFSCGDVPTLPLDFNSREEIKRRLLAKYAISLKQENRCGMCGYLGHSSNWEGCPEQRCVLCRKRGHGKGFCPWAEYAHRWKERQGKFANERRRIQKMEKEKALEGISDRQEVSQKSQAIERSRQASKDQARENSRETLSPRSLVRRQHRLADENQVGISEEEIIVPVAQITGRINEEEVKAPVTQMTTGPMDISFDNAQNISSTATGNRPYPNVNSPERQPMVRSPGEPQNIASTIKANWPSVNGSCPEQQPMIRPFENTQNITSTANDNLNLYLPGRQQMGNTRMSTRLQKTGVVADSTMDPQGHSHDSVVRRYAGINEQRMRAPVAQMTLNTGTMISSFENTQNIPSMTMENWPYVNINTPEQQSLDNTRTGIQLQGTGFGPDSTMDTQGYSYDSGVRRFVGRNEQWMRAPVTQMNTGQMINSFENTRNIASTTEENWPHPNNKNLQRQPWDDTRIGTQRQETGVEPDATMDQQSSSQDSKASRDSESHHDSVSDRDSESDHDSGSDWSESDHNLESSHGSASDKDMESSHDSDSSHNSEAGEDAKDRLDDDGQSSMREKEGSEAEYRDDTTEP